MTRVKSQWVREAALERRVVARAARELGLWQLKMAPTYSTGWPDRMFLIPGGRPLMIEFKCRGGVVSPKQKVTHALLRDLGYDVHVVYDEDTAMELLHAAIIQAAFVPAHRR